MQDAKGDARGKIRKDDAGMKERRKEGEYARSSSTASLAATSGVAQRDAAFAIKLMT